MNAKVLTAGVAVAVMVAGASSAKTHMSRKHHETGGSYAAPSQPIPYSQMDAYMKASPKQRMAMESSGSAATGSSADTSATTQGSAMGSTGSDTSNGLGASGAVNKAPSDQMGSAPGSSTMAPTGAPPNASSPAGTPPDATSPSASPAPGAAGGATPPQ